MVSNNEERLHLEGNGVALSGVAPRVTAADSAMATTVAALTPEELAKKIRKPYKITKSRESWTDPEHDKFLEALQLFDRDWKKIEAFIGSKTVIQIRSHAQKYFLKAQKSGKGEHLPPPRPKRKASHPYPHKASKIDDITSPAISRPMGTYASFHGRVESAYAQKPDSTNVHVLPDFSQVYSFIGSVCDPKPSGHLQILKKMDPIDAETVLLLMRNLSINLTNPEFEDHRRKLLSLYEIQVESTDGGEDCDGG